MNVIARLGHYLLINKYACPAKLLFEVLFSQIISIMMNFDWVESAHTGTDQAVMNNPVIINPIRPSENSDLPGPSLTRPAVVVVDRKHLNLIRFLVFNRFS